MSASLGLFRLQKVDTQIDRALSRLNTIKQIIENDAELKEALTGFEAAQTQHQSAKDSLSNAEAEAARQKIKIEQTESSLYSGAVHNPKELQDLQSELASLKKHLATLEERQIEAMIRFEEAESALGGARGGLESLQSRLGDEHKKLLDEQSALMKDIERLRDERVACKSPVEPAMLSVYEDLRRQKRGVAVAEFSDGECAACGSDITASAQQNAKSAKQLVYCPTCGRILYAS